MAKKLDDKVLIFFKKIGSKGGKATAKRMTKKQRAKRATDAINARWAKR